MLTPSDKQEQGGSLNLGSSLKTKQGSGSSLAAACSKSLLVPQKIKFLRNPNQDLGN